MIGHPVPLAGKPFEGRWCPFQYLVPFTKPWQSIRRAFPKRVRVLLTFGDPLSYYRIDKTLDLPLITHAAGFLIGRSRNPAPEVASSAGESLLESPKTSRTAHKWVTLPCLIARVSDEEYRIVYCQWKWIGACYVR
jgi:hypothetical protein